MSRQLPSRPNLDHLRSQAKELLASSRALHPSWQLADAQFALARGYGFASWPALKAHVDALAAASGGDSGTVVDRSVAVPDTVADDSPLAGTWTANVGASRLHPAFPFQRATLQVGVQGTRITMTQVVVDAAGKEMGGTMTFDADGQPRMPAGGGTNHQLIARWVDARTIEAIDAHEGAEVGRGRYEVSVDGLSLTVTTADQRIVFDRHR
jgi:hypothetical protein